MDAAGTQKRSVNPLLPLVAAIVFLLGFESGGFQLVLTDIAAEFQLDNTAMGSLVTVQYAAILAMPLIFGGISDKIGKKKVTAIAVPVLIAGCVFVVLSRSVPAFLASIFIVGAGYSVAECVGSAALSDSDPHRAEKNLSLTQSLYSLGAVVSPLLINVLQQGGLNWRIVYILTGIGFAVLLPWLLSTKFHRETIPLHEEDKGGGFRLLHSGVFIAMVACIILYVAAENGVAYFADSFFMMQLDSPQFSAYAISAFWLAMAFSRFLFGVIKADPRKTMTCLYCISAVLLVLLSLSQNPVPALVLCALIGASFGPIWPMLIGMANRRFHKHSGAATGIMMAGAGTGGALSPPLLGFLADSIGFRFSMGSLAIFAAAGFVLCMTVLRKADMPEKQEQSA